MKITWTDLKGNELTGKIEPALWPFIEALGQGKAAQFFLSFGGSYVYFATASSSFRNRVTRLCGEEAATRLFNADIAIGSYRVPIANKFLARYLRANGKNINQICRMLRCSDVAVRRLLLSDLAGRKASAKANRNFEEAREFKQQAFSQTEIKADKLVSTVRT